jgi:hypothetical protein
VSGFGATLLIPGQSTDFVVQMDAVVEGTPLGVVSFDSNDVDENPFDFDVSGVVSAANTAPTVSITSPADVGSATAGTPVDLIATANDAEDGDLTAVVFWTSSLDGPLGAGPGGSLTLTDLSVGTHQLTALAIDTLGLPGNAAVCFPIVANAAPTVSITSPLDGGSATAGTPVDLIATANDTEDGNLTAVIGWASDLDGALGAGPGGSLTLTDLSIGTHQLTASVTDSLGLPGNAAVTFTVPEPGFISAMMAGLSLLAALTRRKASISSRG